MSLLEQGKGMKRVAIFGSTGSIGQNALKVLAHLKSQGEAYQVTALAAHSNLPQLAAQIEAFRPERVCLYDAREAATLRQQFPDLTVLTGKEGLEALASHPDEDFIIMAITGLAALEPTLAALRQGKNIGLASKEILAAAGELICSTARLFGASLIPIDSEHSGLFQCLGGHSLSEVNRLVLTASGGPFRQYTWQQLEAVSVKDALSHPTWQMGPKVTIDSSTLMNKGLEMIEARWLFGVEPEKIDVVIHPQSIVHSFIEWKDGSVFAQMSLPDMAYPIQYALTYPQRVKGMFPPFDFVKNSPLEFYSPDYQKFPALTLAREALRVGHSFPCCMNAANEVLVDSFLKGELPWKEILPRLEKLLSQHRVICIDSVDAVLDVDQQARREALA